MRLYSPGSITIMATLTLFIAQTALSQEAPAHGRVSFADASALVKGTSEDEWSFATLNSLVLPGDTLWAVESGVVEIEFSAGSILRMADGSKLDVTSLPPAASLRGWNGSFYIHRMADSAGTVQFESPVAAISVDADSQVRVDILSEGSTTVTVRWGRAVINAEGVNPVVVGQGKRSFIDPGFAPSTPLPFDRNIEDDFDSWNRERARLLVLGNERSPIVSASSQVAPMGAADLNSYGEWIYTDNDYYWRPTYVDDYVPYRNGYWNYEPSHGHVWIGSYPFSYTTSHYGYWDYHDTYGYLWHHDGYWSPGHVAALRYGDYFVWSPINRYGHAIHHGSDYWSVGGLNFSTYGTSYAYAHDVLGGPHQVYGYGHGRGNFGNVVADDIYIWNIDINSSGHSGNRPNPYGDSNLRVRDYEPRRVMRGPSSAGKNGLSARAQVASLRSTQSRDQFRVRGSAASSVRKPTRTANAAQDRTAHIRTNRVQSGTTSTSRNTAQRAARSSRETSRLVMQRSGASTGVTPALTGNVVQSNPTSRRARASNRISSPTRTITNADSKGPSLNRSIRSTRPQASARSTVSTSAPELRGDATGRSRVTRQAPNAANEVTSTNSRRSTRSTYSRPVNTSRRVRAAAPSSPVTTSTNRYSQRTNRSSVNQLAPTRRNTSRTVASPPPVTRQSAPALRTPSRTTPSRSLSRSSATRAAPSSRARTQAPSARARSPRPVSRPSRSSVRSSPAPSSSRSISAPSRGTSRSISAPSRSSAPRSSSSISSSRGGSSRSSGASSSRGSSASRGGSRSPRSR